MTQLKAPDDPGAVVDLTDSIVEGSGSMATNGAVGGDGNAAPRAAPAREPPRTPPSAPSNRSADLSRKPALAGGAEWACPFPAEADRAGVDSAVVAIRVALDASGAVRDVGLQSDPGHGFGRAAQQCARTKRWMPALDWQGKAVHGDVVIRVRFTRD
jgi:protein TonB